MSRFNQFLHSQDKPPLTKFTISTKICFCPNHRWWQRKWRKNHVFLRYLNAQYRTSLPSQLHPCTHLLSLCCLIIFEVNRYSIFGFVSVAGYAAKNVPQERLKWLRLMEKIDPNSDSISVFSVTNVQILAAKKQ